MPSYFQAGTNQPLPYVISIEVDRDDPNPTHSDLVVRWLAFWCEDNCTSEWSVTEKQNVVEMGFGDSTDAVLFKLSPEFSLV